MAWTKIRAMNQLQQTKIQATNQVNQVQGEANEKIEGLQQENETLRNQSGAGVTELAKKLSTAETTINKKELEINRLKERVHEAEQFANITMQPTEAELIARLQKSGYTITKTVH